MIYVGYLFLASLVGIIFVSFSVALMMTAYELLRKYKRWLDEGKKE